MQLGLFSLTEFKKNGRSYNVRSPFHLIMAIDPKCPYLDKVCPKIAEIEDEMNDLRTELKNVSRYLYLIIGMIAVNWGITLW